MADEKKPVETEEPVVEASDNDDKSKIDFSLHIFKMDDGSVHMDINGRPPGLTEIVDIMQNISFNIRADIIARKVLALQEEQAQQKRIVLPGAGIH